MRLAFASLFVAFIGVYAVATYPSIERSATVVEGTVISNSLVRVVEERHYKWELWKADVRVSRVIKQDRQLGDRESFYYGQNHREEWRSEDGKFRGVKIHLRGCPSQPEITLGLDKRFYCVRATVGEDKDILMIPEGGWVEEITNTPRP
jgi:hypothetical protein